MSELSSEMKQELLQQIHSDASRIQEIIQSTYANSAALNSDFRRLEQITYITEQIRLKLKLLGAPRINW